MALETGTYISDLVASNPASSDGLVDADNHMRLIKSTVKATFPNVTGAVNPTHTELNYVAGVTSAIQTQINSKPNLASPAFTGTPTAPTAAALNNSTQLATTAYADAADALKANLASPAFTGTPTAPTAAPGTNTTQLATTAYADAIAALKANLASPTFSGTPAVPTAAPGTNTTQAASSAFVTAAIAAIPAGGGITSLGTQTTPSGTTQSLTGLTLTSYKFLRIVVNAISGSNISTILNINSVAISNATSTARNGFIDVDLTTGIFGSNIQYTSTDTGAAGASGLTTASTSVTLTVTGASSSFSGGSFTVYGMK